MKYEARKAQVQALLTVHDIPMYVSSRMRKPGGVATTSRETPFILVSGFITGDPKYGDAEHLILVEIQRLGSGYHAIIRDHDDDPFDRVNIIEHLVNALDYRTLGRLQRDLVNLTT